MFDTLDVVIGLFFLYLLLSLICTAINEYIAALSNRRGKELIRGIQQLLRDTHAKENADALFDQFMAHPLVDGLHGNKDRYPSYIPARTFAMAFLDVTGESGVPAAAGGQPVPVPRDIERIIQLLKKDSAWDVTELASPNFAAALQSAALPGEVKQRLTGALTGAQADLQKLHDSVEVWFNNAMDRVSGAYKRRTQYALLGIGAFVAIALNADTVQIWRQLAADDDLRASVAQQAIATAGAMSAQRAAQDTTAPAPADTAAARRLAGGLDPRQPNQAEAAALIRTAVAELDKAQLQLGWSWEEARRLGLARKATRADSAAARAAAREEKRDTTKIQVRDWQWTEARQWRPGGLVTKFFGLLVTALALSMGAPFWFDMLNKVISIRAAGRAPHEKPTSPEVSGKRPAEQPIK